MYLDVSEMYLDVNLDVYDAQWQTARPTRAPRAPDLPGNHPGLGLPHTRHYY